MRVAIALTGDRQSGEDLLQAARERVLRRPRAVDSDIEGYLRRILYNLAADGWRRHGRWRQRLPVRGGGTAAGQGRWDGCRSRQVGRLRVRAVVCGAWCIFLQSAALRREAAAPVAEQEMGHVAHLNYRDANKKKLTGSSGPLAAMVAGSRPRLWLNCHAPAKRAGHVRGAGPDRVGRRTGYERIGWDPRTSRGPRSGKPAGPRSATKCRERTCWTGWRA
jgi:hypothetical protein